MATLDEIADALRNAHAAGDTEAATKLADAYVAMKGPQADTEASSRDRGLPPLMMPNWLGQPLSSEAFGGGVKKTLPEQMQQLGGQAVDVAAGAVGSVFGAPGDVQELGVPGFIPGAGAIRRQTGVGTRVFPTSSEVGDFLQGGPPSDPMARGLGGLLGPVAALKAAQVPGAIGRAAMGTAAVPRGASATDQGALFVQNLARNAKVTPETLAQTPKGKPIIGAEAMGPQAETQLMATARREGNTGPQLEAALTERAQSRADRVLQDMADASGIHPDAAKGNIEGVVAAGKEAAQPLYKAAFARPQTAMWSPRLQEFLNQPETKSGLARGLQIQRLEAVSEGRPFNPSDYGIRGMDEAGNPIIGWSKQETARRGGELAPGQFDVPNLRSMDAIKRGLDAMIQDYRNPVTGRLVLDERGKALDAFRRSFVKELDKVAPPEYAAARATAGDYLSAQTAFDRGQKTILNGNLTEKQFADEWTRLSQAERESFKGGIANKLFDLAQNNRLNPKQFLTPRAQAKLATALGPEQARAFINNLQREASMAAFERRATPAAGSQTMPLAQAAKEQDTFGQGQLGNVAADVVMHGPRGAMLNFLAGKRQQLGDLLKTRGLSEEARNEVGRLLMLPPEELAKALQIVPGANLAPRSVNNLRPMADPRLVGMMSPNVLAQIFGQQNTSR